MVVRRPASVFDHYRDADLVVNLSHPEACVESFGLTLLEAMACGIPVVAPPVGGCTELFVDGQGGWLIGSRDIDALCDRILSLRSDREALARASIAARTSAAAFSHARFAAGRNSIVTAIA